jgi:hypothetical protein
MKSLLVVALLVLGYRQAEALSACGNNWGTAPRPGTVVPKYPKIVVFDEREYLTKADYSAQIDGKAVGLKKSTKLVAPYYMTLLEVTSDKAGTLVIFRGSKMDEVARYTIDPKLVLPGKTDTIPATTRRLTKNIRHTTVKELYDALAIDLPELPMISATVKIRRDDKAPWQEFELPINTGDWMEKTKNVIRIGALGCKSNYNPALIEKGVDLEIAVTLADGTTRKVKLPSARTTIPPLPAKKPGDPDDDF